jgi:Flp pilus assembly pilin Flp
MNYIILFRSAGAATFRELKRLAGDGRGQDMIEYGLMAAFVAIVVAGFLPSQYAPSLSTIWSKVNCVMTVLVP